MTKRFLGIDYGSVRIGLAVGDDEVRLAQPFKVIDGQHDPLASIREVVGDRGITGIVLGLPRGLDGQETAQTALVRRFAERLKTLGAEVYFQDEAATTAAVQTYLKSKKLRSRTELDAEAAALILQDFLDALSR
jgi:putative holliday junction resolvase